MTPEPFAQGRLPVGEGHVLFWERCGSPEGRPAVVLHGGPGSGCTPEHRALFDPSLWCVTLFDQRGCGRSTPHAADEPGALDAIDLARHLADIEALRRHLGVERWAVLGGSWGTCLGLAYALAHPERVTALILSGVATCRAAELDFLYVHSGLLLPGAHAPFRERAPDARTGQGVAAAYRPLVLDPDPSVHQPAADAWCAWEAAVVGADPEAPAPGRWADPRFRLGFARQVTHAFAAGAWLEGRELEREAAALGDLPGRLIHSRLDLSAPLSTAWDMARAWPGARLEVLLGGVHSATGPGMAEAVRAATDELASL
ncbi:MAG: alpha/beta fold hydrolase [Pseudomonadota bacterium]